MFRFAGLVTGAASETRDLPVQLSQSMQLLQSDNPGAGVSTLEVFWCLNTSNSDEHRRQAFALGTAVVARVNTRDQGFAKIVRVRVTDLTPYTNSDPERQVNDDIVVVDPSAQSIGRTIQSADPQLGIHEVRSVGPRYIAAYYCKGSYNGPVATEVNVQALPVAGADPGMRIVNGLIAEYRDLNTINKVDTKPKSFPRRTEVRYFDPSKASIAAAIAHNIMKWIGVTAKVNFKPDLVTDRSRNQLEVWLSAADLSRANNYLDSTRGSNKAPGAGS